MIKSHTQALAEPDGQAKERSQLVMQSIKRACASAGGWIRFSEFMNISLYQPGLGYYSGGLQKFGEQGDFITAPEVSSLFGQCLAGQVTDILQNMALGDEACIIEFGAGSGTLAIDILLRLEKLGLLPEKYLILELSAELQHRQQQTIKQKAVHLYDRVQWLNQLPDDVSKAVVIANEVLDAMPVECFSVSDKDVQALMVGVEDEKLVTAYVVDHEASEKIDSIKQRSEIVFTEDYGSEYNPAITGWLSALENKLEQAVILLIDYGYNEKEYYHADRSMGTLMCYYQHKAHSDYFWWPGLQDITAFVNFTDVAYGAVASGLEVSGYTTQAAFLLANGLFELHAEQVTDDAQQQIKLSQQIKTLTLPSEMGERFKVIALTKNYNEPLQGFSLLDLRNRL
ncbi:MAG: SAM-dependent methyltransferase [Gammaproteobacteria bacterium]|nr:SAM-dependent methyltransferase [Gammaproteobacteria bacterium]